MLINSSVQVSELEEVQDLRGSVEDASTVTWSFTVPAFWDIGVFGNHSVRDSQARLSEVTNGPREIICQMNWASSPMDMRSSALVGPWPLGNQESQPPLGSLSRLQEMCQTVRPQRKRVTRNFEQKIILGDWAGQRRQWSKGSLEKGVHSNGEKHLHGYGFVGKGTSRSLEKVMFEREIPDAKRNRRSEGCPRGWIHF